MIYKDTNNHCFKEMEEKINKLSANIAAQHKETDRVEDVCCRLANQNWSLGQSIKRSEKRIKELERESLSAKETINKLCVNLCKLNIQHHQSPGED